MTYSLAPARPLPAVKPDGLGASLAILLLLALTTPLVFSIGPLRLSPYRLVLLTAFAPLLIAFIAGRAGRATAVDRLVFFAAIWAIVALAANHGAAAVETGGVFLLEFLGGYLVGRVCIRSPRAFARLGRAHFALLLALLPFAAVEAFTGRAPLIELFDLIGRSFDNHFQTARLGLERAQVVFEHPILYGVFAMSGVGLMAHLWRGSPVKGAFAYLAACLSVLFSVSTGAIVGLAVQTFAIGWDRALRAVKARWKILLAVGIAAYFAVDALSNRTPFHVFVDYLTLNSGSAYNRILIFEFGAAEVARHPVFGIGHGDWTRPAWMSDSFDNFWLLNAMRYGLPMAIALIAAIAILIRRVARRSFRDGAARACQAGYLTSVAGLIVAGATVHFWNASFVWAMILIGAGVWMVDYRDDGEEGPRAMVPKSPPAPHRSLGRERRAPSRRNRTLRDG
ncbi:MAG: O-antigen ligase family protein [Pseudomonadota bacterium]